MLRIAVHLNSYVIYSPIIENKHIVCRVIHYTQWHLFFNI